MPYIKEDARERIRATLGTTAFGLNDVGELNYTLTTILMRYFHQHGGRYQQINDVLGALEGAKLEFYRRVAAPYEAKKIAENGDVY